MTRFIKVSMLAIAVFSCQQLSAQALNDTQIKKNVQPIDNALTTVKQLDPKTYEYNQAGFAYLNLPSGQQNGFLANDVQQVNPSLVKQKAYMAPSGKNSYKSSSVKDVDLQAMIPLLVGAIKEQQLQIESLQKQLAELAGSKTISK